MEKGIGKDGYFRFIFFFSNAMTSQIIITVEFTSFFKKETYLEPVLNIQNFHLPTVICVLGFYLC
jgi:hypothetical protein